MGGGLPRARGPRAQERPRRGSGDDAAVRRRPDRQGAGGARRAAVRRLRARSRPPRHRHRSRALREIRGPAAQERRPAARGYGRRLGRHRGGPGRRHRLQPQEAAETEELDRSAEGPLGLAPRDDGLPDHVRHRVDHRDRQAVRRLRDERRAVLRRDQEGAVQGRGHWSAGVDARAVPAGAVRHHLHQHADGGHPARTRRRHRVREAGERRRRVLHDHARRQGLARGRKRLQILRHGHQRARAVRADATAEQLHPGESRREAGGRPAHGLARRDGEVRAARLVEDQSTPRRLDRALQQGSRQVTVRVRPAEWQLALPLALAYAAFFLVPLLLLIGVSAFDDEKITTLGFAPAPLRLLQTEHGLVIALTQIEMPLLLLPLLSVMSRMDPSLRDASAALGASKWRTLVRVTLPLSLPGLVAGCMLVFASSTTAFISQFVIGGNRLVYLPLLIWQQSLVVYNWPLASVAALTLLVSVGQL